MMKRWLYHDNDETSANRPKQGTPLKRQTSPKVGHPVSRQITPLEGQPITRIQSKQVAADPVKQGPLTEKQWQKHLRRIQFTHKVSRAFIDNTKKEIQRNSKWFHDWVLNGIEYETLPDGQRGSIVSYDELYAITVGWFIPRDGSAFNGYQSLIICGSSIVISTLLGYFSCAAQEKVDPQSTNCIALPEPSTTYLTLLTLCSFVLAFFINMVVNRWWQTRLYIGSINSASQQCIMLLVNVLSTELHEYRAKPRVRIQKEINSKKLLKRMAGFLLLSYRLMINKARKSGNIDDLLEENIITQKDYDYFTSFDAIPADVCTCMLKLLHEAARKGLFLQRHRVSESNMTALSKTIFTIQESTNQLNVIVTVQLPFPFVQLIAAIVYCFIIQLVLVASAYIAVGIAEGNSSNIIIGVITILLYNVILLGMLKLFTILCNPLRDHVADFPLSTYFHKLEKSLNTIINNASLLDELVDLDDDDLVLDFEDDNGVDETSSDAHSSTKKSNESPLSPRSLLSQNDAFGIERLMSYDPTTE